MIAKHLMSPFKIRNCEFRNRIFSTGHMTRMITNGLPNEQMVAYHEARASGGAGLIITEAARVHDSALSDSPAIDASTDACIEAYHTLASKIQAHGCKVFGQVSHSGRVNDRRRNGLLEVPYSAFASPDERFHNMPREMDLDMINEVVEAYASAALRLMQAGFDGIEVPASHGLLPAQFLNPRVNLREDEYGGILKNRLRFLCEILQAIRAKIGDFHVLGIRISVDEMEHNGLTCEESMAICQSLGQMKELDYFNVVAGSMAGLAGSVHVVPPMMISHGYTAPLAQSITTVSDKPVFVAGRINQVQIAENILSAGQAHMCGMTRALIADPQMPNKIKSGHLDEIRACIGCNQACIGHYHLGKPISCIQNPKTGREREFGSIVKARAKKRLIVVGAGPAGLKSAVTARRRGHEVILCETCNRIGGQVNLAQLLPGRTEFGGLILNLEQEAKNSGVDIRLNTTVNRQWIEENSADAFIIATGAKPYRSKLEGEDSAHVVDAWQVLQNEVKVGGNVLIADWRADWVGLGLAELLTRQGSHVRLAVNGITAGQEIQSYMRDQWLGTLHSLGVKIIPYMRLFGVDEDTVYLQHTLSNEAVICENVDTLVLAQGHSSVNQIEQELKHARAQYFLAGDCLSPRTAEEAVYEGMMAALKV